MPRYRTVEALSGKIYAPIFWFQSVIGLIGWAGDYQNILGKVGDGEMKFGGVNVHALDLGEIQCGFLASQMRFMNIYM